MKTKNIDLDPLFKELEKRYPRGRDPWGLNLVQARKILERILPFYCNYFSTRIFGTQHIKDGPYMAIANHSGQIAIDGLLISTAFLLESENPIVLRPMIDRFMMKLPFFGKWALEGGAVLGDRKNCQNLLKAGESVLVFPEGVKGVSKSTNQFYHLQRFTRGFLRLALSTGTPIIPISVVGAEEFYPFVYQARSLAKLLKLPALPISPLFPFLGPIGAIPFPSPVDIYIHEPYHLPTDVSPESQDKVLDEHIFKIQRIIQEGINEGLKNKRSYLDNSVRLMLELKEDVVSKLQK